MAIEPWSPPQAATAREQRLLSRTTQHRKLISFLRLYRHELFDSSFQEELAAINQYILHAEMCENWGYHRLSKFTKMQSIGEMKVAGLSMPEAVDAITKKYATFLREPVITISLRDIAKPMITVGGFVVKPGRLELRGPVTLTDAVMMAGGFIIGAKDSEVLLFRRASTELVEVRKVDAKWLLENGHMEEDIALRGGDAIYVSRGKVAKIDRFMQVSRLGLYFNPIPTLK